MDKNKLKDIHGKKIRRQYFNVPLIILYASMLAIPYGIFTISFCIGKFDPSEWPSTLWMSFWTCFCFSLPLLILRTLNKNFFGRIICVFTKEGIHYPNGMLRWETVEKIEYAIDSKPRYKSDLAKAFRAIIYTRGGKHVVLPNSPLCLLSRAKKFKKELTIKISGVTSLLPIVLIMTAVISLCPFYVVLLAKSPGVSEIQFIAVGIIGLALSIIKWLVLDAYSIKYRFWRWVLPRKWLFYIIFWAEILFPFAAILLMCYFPSWWVVILVGICFGVLPIEVQYGYGRSMHLLSYEQLYEIYITRADFWEQNIKKNKEKRLKRKK